MDNTLNERINKLADKFGQLPAWAVKLNIWASLSRNETKVFGVLVALQDNKTHVCDVKLDVIAVLSGVSYKSISSATNKLCCRELIKKERSGNRNIYTICHAPPKWLVEAGGDWVVPEYPHSSEIPKNKHGKFTSHNHGTCSPQ
ncbi:MAG TPA: hypothetical protein PK876_02405 [Elusimicrobiota bacterium]|nr:hypothetical protein [Elusimicrobiota bacterium]